LPLTEENTGILSAELFQRLPTEQAALIHVGGSAFSEDLCKF
jgi:glyoxylate/hydroxypyruvate reductase A